MVTRAELTFKVMCVLVMTLTLYFPQHCPASWGPNLTSPASEVINKARAASEKNLGAKKYLPTDLLLEVLLFLLLLLFVQMGPAGH